MKKFLFTSFLLIIGFASFSSFGQTDKNEEKAAELRKNLSSVKTTSDSIKILYDIFDLLPRQERVPVGKEIYDLATRSNNSDVRLDILRLISVIYEDEAILKKIQDEISRIPASQEKDETLLFIKMRRLTSKSRSLSEEERQKEIVNILHHYEDSVHKDKLRNILDLYALVVFMRNDASGDMQQQYMGKLIEMVNSPDVKLYAIENNIFTEAANIYSDAQDYDKALRANKKVLDIIDGLEKTYHEKGRNFRNYDVSRYVCYRRMLRNAKGLQPGEAEKYYSLAKDLAAKNSDVKQDFETNPRIHAYYYYAIGDYGKAMTYLKDIVTRKNTLASQKQFLEMLIDASQKTGDVRTRLEALTEYASLLSEMNDLKAAEKSRELQIKYDLQDLKTRNQALELDNREKEIKSERQIMTFVTVAFVILLIVLIIMLYNWGRYRKNTMMLGHIVDNLHRERYRLRHSLYGEYGEEFDPLAEEDKFKDLNWQKRIKNAHENLGNATMFMTQSIMNDLLFIAAIGHADMIKHISEISVDSILRQVESTTMEKAGNMSNIRIEYPDHDFKIKIDSSCLITILTHMADVASNYFISSITHISCMKPESGHLDFVITVDATGAASDKDPQIFHNMAISNILLNHEKSGLFVCRMISLLLQCEIIPDKNYNEGARYIFRTPQYETS